jgi:hypothetical protein
MKKHASVAFTALVLGLFGQSALAEQQQICNDRLRPSTPAARFIDNGDGTVTDVSTGLMWSKCDFGQQWSGNRCSNHAVLHEWADALNAIRNSNVNAPYAGKNDWRMPNIKELVSIVEWSCTSPAINTQVFEADPDNTLNGSDWLSLTYWSSTPAFNPLRDVQDVWTFNFELPERQDPMPLTPFVSTDPDYPDEPPVKLKVRLVRDASVP